MAMHRVISHATAGMVDMQAQTVTLPLSVYLDLCSQHGHDDEMDDFLMYTYKVRRCPRTRAHDWTECPYAHRGEKARRRDPRKFPYQGIVCPDFKNGECNKGQNCEYAHGIFEFWLHPSRFRTQVCESGVLCPRKVCFFAHTPEQLRLEGVHHCSRCGQQERASDSEAGGAIGSRRRDEAATVTTETTMAAAVAVAPPPIEGAGGSTVRVRCEVDEAYNDFEHLEWVVDLVNW